MSILQIFFSFLDIKCVIRKVKTDIAINKSNLIRKISFITCIWLSAFGISFNKWNKAVEAEKRGVSNIFQMMDPEIIVSTKLGKIRGKSRVSCLGTDYFSFQGIPFAHPPTGKFRFKVISITPYSTLIFIFHTIFFSFSLTKKNRNLRGI